MKFLSKFKGYSEIEVAKWRGEVEKQTRCFDSCSAQVEQKYFFFKTCVLAKDWSDSG